MVSQPGCRPLRGESEPGNGYEEAGKKKMDRSHYHPHRPGSRVPDFRRPVLPRHPPALFSTTEAGFGAALAMFHMGMPGAFLAAGLADLGTEPAELRGEPGIARHQLRGQKADRRAIAVQLYAAHHRLDVLFLQTCGGTSLALAGTGVTGLYALMILLIGHTVFSRLVRLSTPAGRPGWTERSQKSHPGGRGGYHAAGATVTTNGAVMIRPLCWNCPQTL